jgi:hypothetical protein
MMPPTPSKQGLYLNPTELDRLYGLPHVAQLLYFAIRRQMNYDDGLVGNRYPISWLELSQALWVEPHQGRQNVGRPEKAALRKSAQLLITEGLIVMKSDVLAKRLIFKCELAGACDSPAMNIQKPLFKPGLTDPSFEMPQNEKPSKPTQGSKPQVKLPTDEDKKTAERLFEIKQNAQAVTRKPNLQNWAVGVMTLKEKVLMPNDDGNGEHPISDKEIEQAFVYAFQVNRFWTERGIITSPKTLLDHLNRPRKPTFREAFINWLEKGAPNNETHHTGHGTTTSARKTDPVREGFGKLGIHINA